MIRFGPYQLDRAQGLRRDGRELHLTPKSLAVLCTLAERAGDVISKDQLFRAVWPDTAVSDAALTSCIQELRHVLRDDARRPAFIETLHRRGYRFCAHIAPDRRADADAGVALPREESSCVGRDAILASMFESYHRAEGGTRQVLFVTGEAGVGKTTLVRTFRTRLLGRVRVRTTWGQCVQHYGVGEPYQPLLDALTRLGRQDPGAQLIPLLERYSPTWLAQLPALAAPEHLATLRRTSAGTTRERMLRELTDALEAATAVEPLVLVLEDLHWSDTSTLDWIAAFAQRPELSRLLVIGTLRPPSEDGPEHPVTAIADALSVKGLCQQIVLAGLDEADVLSYLALRCPPASGQRERMRRLARLIHEHTGGNPLFVGSVLADLTARGLITANDGLWIVKPDVDSVELGISDDVRRMISKQVDRLRPEERSTLEVASVAGDTFSTAALAGAGLASNEVDATLAALARRQQFVRDAGQIEWPDGTIGARYEFLHALYRDVLYRRVSPGRRAELHRQVGSREEAAYGARAPEIAAELAMHFERSGDPARAGVYLEHAAQNARGRSAYAAARVHFERALALLASEPPSAERSARELPLQIGRGAAIMAARGWSAPEVAEAYSRARALSSELGDTPRLFPALWGLWLFYWGQGPLSTASELVHELLELAHRDRSDVTLLQAHHAGWATSFSRGDLEAACTHATAGLTVYEVDRHASLAAIYGSHDAAMCALNFRSWALALRGRVDEAARASAEAIAMTARLSHPFSIALAHFFAAATAQTRRDAPATRAYAAVALRIAREQDFRLVAGWALTLEGWAATENGEVTEGLDQIENAVTEVQPTGATQFLPYFFGLKASAHLKSGEGPRGLRVINDALAMVRTTGECFWESELYRVKGELLLVSNGADADHQAERAFLHSLEIARRQRADLIALRTAVSLSRLWCRLDRHAEAGELLAASMTTVADTAAPDVADASALLASL